MDSCKNNYMLFIDINSDNLLFNLCNNLNFLPQNLTLSHSTFPALAIRYASIVSHVDILQTDKDCHITGSNVTIVIILLPENYL